MTNPAPQTELLEIAKGMVLLLGCHALALGLIVALAFLAESIWGLYSGLWPLIVGLAAFFVWQLLYVVPLILWLRRRGRVAMAKGVVIAAVLTALVNGACFLVNFGYVGR